MDLERRQVLGLLGVGITSGAVGYHATRPTAGRVTAPDARPETTGADVDEYVRGMADFGCDLLGELVGDEPGENVLLSPTSISGNLAMLRAGARGATGDQMDTALGYTLGEDRLHPAVGALQHDLSERATTGGRDVPQVWRERRFELTIANAVWAQSGFGFREAYLGTLAETYGAELDEADFETDHEAARAEINDWVADATNDRIDELFPQGTIDHRTRLVLANAVALLADWAKPFDPDDTEEREFTTLDGSTATVPTMYQREEFPWLRTEEYAVVELPYVGEDVSFVVVLPAEGTFETFEASIDADWLAARLGELDERGEREVRVSLPRFEFEYDVDLVPPLEALGMVDAFEDDAADLTGMAPPEEGGDDLFVGDVVHDAYVAVDEQGTEVVAATGSTVRYESAPPKVTVDRPFLFFVRDRPTDAVLFVGRVVDPSGEES